LLSPVNPKKSDRIRIGAILRLNDDENRAGLLLKPRCLVEEERADMTSVPDAVDGSSTGTSVP
jgi:hypothetical protein